MIKNKNNHQKSLSMMLSKLSAHTSGSLDPIYKGFIESIGSNPWALNPQTIQNKKGKTLFTLI
jgi:hypothetical protein